MHSFAEDFCILLHFIGSSLFALKRYDDAVGYFGDSAERKKNHFGRTDEEYAMSVIDLAAAYAKIGDENRSMEVRLSTRSKRFYCWLTRFTPLTLNNGLPLNLSIILKL